MLRTLPDSHYCRVSTFSSDSKAVHGLSGRIRKIRQIGKERFSV
jgi:hypothetical protein